MDQPKPVAEMTDLELVREYECVEECDFSAERTNALVDEIERRNLDI